MVERTPEEIKNAGKAFTPEEIAEGKAKRDELWASEPVEVVAPELPETRRGGRRKVEPEPEVGQGAS